MNKRSESRLRLSVLACIVATGLAVAPVSRADCTGSNTCFGVGALPLDSGFNNSAFGFEALFNNQHVFLEGEGNTAVGHQALFGNVSGNDNTAVGDRAMRSNTTGVNNTAMGRIALGNNTVGGFNTALGVLSMVTYTTGSYNTAVGYQALSGQPENGANGNYNTATGGNALTTNFSGDGNTATGFDSLHSNSRGRRNTANGVNALGNVTTGDRNTAIGAGAGRNVVTGNDNILIGAETVGNAASNGVIRIGSSSFQKTAHIAGVRGVTTGLANATTVFIDGNGQLGTVKSSREYKEQVEPVGELSDRIFVLRPVKFVYRQAFDDGSKPIQFGLIAEEVAADFSGTRGLQSGRQARDGSLRTFSDPAGKRVSETGEGE